MRSWKRIARAPFVVALVAAIVDCANDSATQHVDAPAPPPPASPSPSPPSSPGPSRQISPNGPGPIHGTFILRPPTSDASRKELFDYLDEMRMDTVIVEATRERPTGCSSAYQWVAGYSAQNLADLLQIAGEHGTNVYVGLGSVRQNWTCSPAYYLEPNRTQAREDLAAVFAELESICASKPACQGWYLADEPRLTEWAAPAQAHAYYRGLVDIVRAAGDTRPVLASPFLAGATSASAVAALARAFRDDTGVTVQIWQDSEGQASTNLGWRAGESRLDEYYRALSEVLGPSGLWAVTELFNHGSTMDPARTGGYRPSSITRINEQLSFESTAWVGKRLAWISASHLSDHGLAEDGALPEATRLKAAYRAAYGFDGGGRLLAPVEYAFTTPPVSSVDSGGELFNRRTGDPTNPNDGEWIGIQAWTSGGTQIRMRYDQPQTIDWVGVHLLNRAKDGILLPEQLILDCTDSGTPERLGAWDRPAGVATCASAASDECNSEYVLGNVSAIGKACQHLTLTLAGASGWHYLSEIEVVVR